jgi:hypothetical protein
MLNVIIYKYNLKNETVKWAVLNPDKRLLEKGERKVNLNNVYKVIRELQRDYHTTIAVPYRKETTLIRNLLNRVEA